MSDNTMALVEVGEVLGSRQLDMRSRKGPTYPGVTLESSEKS